jgi:hypothetical protein
MSTLFWCSEREALRNTLDHFQIPKWDMIEVVAGTVYSFDPVDFGRGVAYHKAPCSFKGRVEGQAVDPRTNGKTRGGYSTTTTVRTVGDAARIERLERIVAHLSGQVERLVEENKHMAEVLSDNGLMEDLPRRVRLSVGFETPADPFEDPTQIDLPLCKECGRGPEWDNLMFLPNEDSYVHDSCIMADLATEYA